jgi:hypothetical protein
LSPFTSPPKQPQSNGSTLFPTLQTHAPTLPSLGPANSSPQTRPSLPCPSSLIPHSPLHCRRSHSRDFVPWRFSDACCQRSRRGPHPGVRKTCTRGDSCTAANAVRGLQDFKERRSLRHVGRRTQPIGWGRHNKAFSLILRAHALRRCSVFAHLQSGCKAVSAQHPKNSSLLRPGNRWHGGCFLLVSLAPAHRATLCVDCLCRKRKGWHR